MMRIQLENTALFTAALALALAAAPAAVQAAPPTALDALAKLNGTWEGTAPNGKAMQVSFKAVSEGTAVVESHEGDGHSDAMITVYHLDGDDLVLTHYCSMGNQPRMRAARVAPGAKEIVFSFIDSTNLAKPDAPHMHKLVFKIEDADHITQEWTMKEGAKEHAMPLRFTRKKA